MSSQYIYDYYEVSVPGDVCRDMDGLLEVALTEAKERAKLHCTPAIWIARRVSGEVGDAEVVVRVTRKRRRTV